MNCNGGEIGMMYCIGALIFILGVIILVKVFKGAAVSVLWEGWLGILLLLMGLAIIVLTYGADKFFWKDYTMLPVMAGFGLIAYSIFVQNVWRTIVCKQKIMAEYKGCQTNRIYRRPDTYTPIFSYEWEGEIYRNILSGYACSKKEIQKYRSGVKYEIYLNPRNPRMIQTIRRLRGGNILMLVVGTIFFCALMVSV